MRALCWLLLTVSTALPGSGQDQATRQLIKTLESRYSASKSLRAVFEERYYENGRLLRTESGRVYFRRPGKMRWDYEIPESKVFLSDGKTVWLYVPAERTAMRTSVKESSDSRTPFSLLTRNPRLSRLCESVDQGNASEAVGAGNEVLRCRPRRSREEAREGEEILIEMNPRTGELSRVKISQGGGAAIEFFFSQWAEVSGPEESRFHFVPPAGVAIVDAPTGNSSMEGDMIP
jgi:outer membrane lipoprotein carrier protein